MIEVEDKPIIKDLDFSLKSGELMVVVGQVGSGKTTILHSVMEETKLCSGKKEIEGTIAYVEQEPFIISGTIKDNIMMGLEYDQVRFEKALEAS